MTEIADAEVAMKRARANQYRWWGGRADKEWPNEAAARIGAGGALAIGHTPRFTLPRDCSVYTIGSCFARNIERKLAAIGIDVPSMRFRAPGERYQAGENSPPNAVLNKFTIHSISSEFARVLEGKVPPNRGFIPEPDGTWLDPQATYSGSLSWELVNELRDAIEATTASVREADAVFITLGLTEGWLDSETGVHLNGDLPRRQMLLHPGRFKYVNPDYAELVAEGRRIVEMIQAHGKPNVKILFTVSPVPLNSTFSDQDVIVANTYSKSMLRAVAQTLRTLDRVDYFPSYEMVVFSERPFAWKRDQRHVTPELVDAVTGRFVELYVD